MTSELPEHHTNGSDGNEEVAERPWIDLKSTHDVEAWIDNYNWELRRLVTEPNAEGVGICFILVHGGEIFMHTDPEGQILLDVTPEAEWVNPVITAATGVEAPNTQFWLLPGDVLTQLIFGLSGLIASTRPVTNHSFRPKKRGRITW